MAGRASVCVCNANPVSVGVECRTMARTELGKSGAVLARKEDFFLVDVRGLEVEDPVRRPGPD